MPTPEELITALQTRILDLEKALEEVKARPNAPSHATEIADMKNDLAALRKDLSELKPKPIKPAKPSTEVDEDVSLGHFSGD